MSLEARIAAFINDPNPSAIAIIGKWGQGKTYFWQRAAEAHAPSAKAIRSNYANVSLFGLNSLSDLRVELAQRIRKVDQIKEDTFAALLQERINDVSKFRKIGRLFWRKFRAIAGAATGASVSLSHIGNLGPLYRAWAYSQVRNALICLDDLERRGSGLDLKDVLGLVSQLVTERNCSIVVIFNDGSFDDDDKEIWRDNREKVFLGEVTYTATSEQCLGYVYHGSVADMDELDQFTRQAILDLGITNVRIIERIKSACDQVRGALPNELLPETRHRIARCIALYVYTLVGQGDGAPPPHEGIKSGARRALDRMNRKQGDPEPTPEQKQWTQLLNRYAYHFHGELDDALIDSINQGYPEVWRLLKAASDQDLAQRALAVDEQFEKAWVLFHDSFDDNGVEVVKRMHDAFSRLHTTMNSMNADSTIRLMRTLGEEQLADNMMDQWVADRSNAERWDELSKAAIEMFEPIKDKRFKSAVEHAHAHWESKEQPSFAALLDELRRDRFLPPARKSAIAAADINQYVDYLRRSGSDLARLVGSLLTMESQDGADTPHLIRDQTLKALDQLSEECGINKVRIAWKLGDEWKESL